MNSGLKLAYRYLTQTYYHQKKGWNIHLARLFCLIAAPLTNLFYKGLNLISSYEDYRLKHTINESIEVINNGGNVVIFPENSSEGYFEELKEFYAGFALLAERLYRRGYDIPIYACYLRAKENVYLFDKPLLYSELKDISKTKEAMAEYLLNKVNALGKMDLSEIID
ncbi:MAG: hypothetical protein ACOX5X_01665 [Acholeplasmataceae bacterium]|jgi:1-acyl-sn-glycerol-3-phosphate acyltransferase